MPFDPQKYSLEQFLKQQMKYWNNYDEGKVMQSGQYCFTCMHQFLPESLYEDDQTTVDIAWTCIYFKW